MFSQDNLTKKLWEEVAAECPVRIIPHRHQQGHYVHGTASRCPSRVLCIGRDAPKPAGWQPTPAQMRAWQAEADSQPVDIGGVKSS
jgi:hypothetical protein